MKDILYFNSAEDIRLIDTLRISNKDKELPNQIILTIQSAGAGVGTPIFSNSGMGTTVFALVNEIGTKFILDEKEVTSDDFQVVTKSKYGINYNFFGLQFEDSNEHILKISLVNSTIPNFQRISQGPGYSANSITSVVIGNSITGIDSQAFRDCTGLTSITVPDSVTMIGRYTFAGCTGLTSVTIPDSVTEIGNNAFQGCTSLKSITIPDSVKVISGHAFYGCTGLTSVTLPDSLTKIGDFVFSGCTGLTSVTIPDSVTVIGDSAFNQCTGLTSVVIPDSVTEIGSNTFSSCTGITSLTWNAVNCSSKGNMPTYNIEQLSIGNEVQILPDNFVVSSKITSVTIPNSVTTIGYQAFAGCGNLTSVTIGNSVTTIGESAFESGRSLTSITSLATTAPAIQSKTFRDIKTNGTLHVPAGSDYSTWMSTDNYYLGKYNWTKVEDAQ